RRGRYRHHRDDVHRLRPSGREVVEPHRRSHRVGELRDRTRSRHRPRRPRGGPGRGEEGRLRGTGPQTRRRCLVPTRRRGAAELPAPTPHPRHRPHRAAHGRHHRARAGRGVAVPRLGMGLRPRGPAARDVRRPAVPPRGATVALALVEAWRFPGWEWVCVLVALPIVTWAAWPFHRSAWKNLVNRTTNMDTLVSLGIIAAFGWAVVTAAFGFSGPDAWLGFGVVPDGADALYLDVAAGVTTFQLAGRYFETRSRRKAGDLLAALSDLAPKTARVRGENGAFVDTPIESVRPGDIALVRP